MGRSRRAAPLALVAHQAAPAGHIFEYVEGFYNKKRRRHSALGYLSPVAYEEVRMSEAPVA
jgi:hypothetical protein